jgi:hypothetical protein
LHGYPPPGMIKDFETRTSQQNQDWIGHFSQDILQRLPDNR